MFLLSGKMKADSRGSLHPADEADVLHVLAEMVAVHSEAVSHQQARVSRRCRGVISAQVFSDGSSRAAFLEAARQKLEMRLLRE